LAEILGVSVRVTPRRTGDGRKLLAKRSPLTYAGCIRKPLLIGQGANDPWVGQIVTAMREKGIPVTYVLYPDEGHGFARPENRRSFCAVAVVSPAEAMPLADASVDLVVSRGSIFFWRDPAAGVREAYRVLRRGGKAMLGGGLGSGYPVGAREVFMRRRYEGVLKEGPEAVRCFQELRRPETFRWWAVEAGLMDFDVAGEGGLSPEDARAGLGIWLRFTKR